MSGAQDQSNSVSATVTENPTGFLASLTEAVSERDGTLQPSGEILFRCPLPDHEDVHPSARFDPRRGVWYCDSCSNGGGPHGLAELLGVELPECTLAAYAAEKQLPLAALERMGLTTAKRHGKPAVRIPYLNPDGTEGPTRWRTAMTGKGRFSWNKGSKPQLYGLDRLEDARAAKHVWLVEGESDVQTLWLHDEPALGIPGASNWKEQRDAPHLDGIDTIYVVVEPDKGGETMVKRLSTSRIWERVRLVDLSKFSAKDPSELHCLDSGKFDEWLAEAKAEAVPVTDVTQVTPSEGEGEGHLLFDDVLAHLRRYVIYPSVHAAVAHALWIGHTHLMPSWDSTPRFAFLSPEPSSGKTRALEVSELLVPNPVLSVNVSPSYLFRKVGDQQNQPTILYDEIDTVFGPKAGDHEDVRALINAGHRKGATAGRCVVQGVNVITVEFPAYSAVAVAGLGDLPDTILARSVVVRMRRRGPGEMVEPYRPRLAQAAGDALRVRMQRWAKTVEPTIGDPWPEMPEGVEDRDADVWEALIAVADAAGGEWPQRAREAAITLVQESKESTPSINIRLLEDLRSIFSDHDHLFTDTVIQALYAKEEAPWVEQHYGKPFLNKTGLSKRLGEYGIKAKPVRIGEKVQRGYKREDLIDAWMRYLPPPKSREEEAQQSLPSPSEPVTPVTPVTDPFNEQPEDGAGHSSFGENDPSLHVDRPNGPSKFETGIQQATVEEVIAAAGGEA